jgi:para-nitrobenzyl esterase
VATTTSGKLRGYVDSGINVFKGIPYGEDTAARRFMPPLPAKPWTGIRDALNYGPQAPQPQRRPGSNPNGTQTSMSEDCLNLNLWTPGLRDGGKRPVMVWFHPGEYRAGTSNSPGVDGVRLCKRGDVVVLGVNHRLGIFGYLYLAQLSGEFPDSGNVGQLDLILALRWVHDNIAEFGGDPDRVLIFGQSGGGAKVATLMAMPPAHGLFHRACSSSGEAVTSSRPETATERSRAVLKALDLAPTRIDALKTIPMDKLIEVSRPIPFFGPVVDGRSLTRHPFEPDAPPISAHIPFLAGTNHDESRLLLGRRNPALFNLTWDTLKEKLVQYGEGRSGMGSLDLNRIVSLYRRLHPDYSASDVFFAATTDSRDWRPALVEIERRAAQPKGSAPTYSYELDWGSPVDPKMKACHGLDVPFLFDNVALSHALTGTAPEAYWMAEQMSEAYIAFARTGNPNTAKLPHWPAYDLTTRPTMTFNKVSKVVDDPRSGPRRLFSEVPYENPGT